MRRYALLDRDGTIIEEKNYLGDPAGVALLPGAAEGMRLLREAGFGLAVLTNQSGIGRGYYTEADMRRVHARMRELLEAEGVVLDGIYFCPHTPEDGCSCRKPATGMAEQAARDLGFSLKDAYVVGDKPADVELAARCGAVGILVRTGYGARAEQHTAAAYVADDLVGAARWIIGRNPSGALSK